MQLSAGGAFQTEETASAKAPRQESPGAFKCVPVWLEQRGMGVGALRETDQRGNWVQTMESL